MKSLIIFTLFSLNIAFAGTLVKVKDGYKIINKKFELASIAEDYAKILGYALIVDAKMNDKINAYGPRIIKADQLDLFVSAILNSRGYTLLINNKIKQIEVINSRDIRYKGGSVIKEIKNVPNTYNYFQFVMNLMYVNSNEVSRNLRPFISRYGRVISEKNANTIIIADSGRNIHRIHGLIKKLDTAEFLKRRKLVEKINSESKKTITKNKSILSYIKDQHILFLIAFSLIGGIIGFGIRGYMMKKVEGGW